MFKSKKIIKLLLLLFLVTSVFFYTSISVTAKNILHNLEGTYTGSYFAHQGATGLTLTITKNSNLSNTENFEALFEFYSIPENPNVPYGSYTNSLVLNEDNSITLTGKKWIEQPNNWEFVKLNGTLDNNILSGYISDKNNSKWEFSVEKQTGDNKPSSWAKPSIDDAITEGFVPLSLQKNYTKKINRKNFTRLIITAIANYKQVPFDEFLITSKLPTKKVLFNDSTNYYVISAASIGIINGYENNNFKPNNFITRQEAATILMRMAKVLDVKIDTTYKKPYSDENLFKNWSKDAINYVSNTYSFKSHSYIMTGFNNNFNPNDNFTVEQAIMTIYRLINTL